MVHTLLGNAWRYHTIRFEIAERFAQLDRQQFTFLSYLFHRLDNDHGTDSRL